MSRTRFRVKLHFLLAPVTSKEFLDIQATIECGFTLKCVRDMIRTYSQVIATTIFESIHTKEKFNISQNFL